jgi:hypothetical protein
MSRTRLHDRFWRATRSKVIVLRDGWSASRQVLGPRLLDRQGSHNAVSRQIEVPGVPFEGLRTAKRELSSPGVGPGAGS